MREGKHHENKSLPRRIDFENIHIMRTSLYLFDAAEELARGRLSQNLFASPSPDSPGDTTPPVHFFVSAPSSMPRRSLSVNASSGPAPSRISWMTPSHAAPPSTSTCGRRASSWPAAPDSLPLHLPISLALDTTLPVPSPYQLPHRCRVAACP
jgi:hypothetical protein